MGKGSPEHSSVNNFSLLDQEGPFATTAESSIQPFSLKWIGSLTPDERTKFRAVKDQLFQLLGVRSFSEIQFLISNPQQRASVSERAYRLLDGMYGIEGAHREIVSKIDNYASIADGVIDHLQEGILQNFAPKIEMINEVQTTNNPTDLILIIFDSRYHSKARFEAKRKLILMNLAGAIDQRERETEIERKFADFLGFLNQHVWSPDSKIGESELAYLLSTHDKESFKCTSVAVLSEEAGKNTELQAGQKLTLLRRRTFTMANGRDIPIYVTIRQKSSGAKILKLLRKGLENPAVAVDDEMGLMGVLNSLADVHAFQTHLTRSASNAGSLMTLEEISDTLGGNDYPATNYGSSPNIQMCKFFAKIRGMRIEFILHTNATYVNYLYQRGVSHDEYETRRFFDSGVAKLLFPPQLYGLDLATAREALIQEIRQKTER